MRKKRYKQEKNVSNTVGNVSFYTILYWKLPLFAATCTSNVVALASNHFYACSYFTKYHKINIIFSHLFLFSVCLTCFKATKNMNITNDTSGVM